MRRTVPCVGTYLCFCYFFDLPTIVLRAVVGSIQYDSFPTVMRGKSELTDVSVVVCRLYTMWESFNGPPGLVLFTYAFYKLHDGLYINPAPHPPCTQNCDYICLISPIACSASNFSRLQLLI